MLALVRSIKQKIIRALGGYDATEVRSTLIDRGLLSIGRHTYGSPRFEMFRGSEAPITIGAFCSISRGVVFMSGGIHPLDWVSLFPFRIRFGLDGAYEDGMPTTSGPIVVGSDVWIGTDAMVLSGVTIGHGAIVAARSVVTRDVPPYAVVAGVPAKVLRFRFGPGTIERLLRIRWWDWPDDRIREEVGLLSSKGVEDFVARHDPSAP